MRILVAVESTAFLQRPEPFAIRQMLCANIKGLTLTSAPGVALARTGWATTPADLKTRKLFDRQVLELEYLSTNQILESYSYTPFSLTPPLYSSSSSPTSLQSIPPPP
jgi:hypothetical protein